MKNFVAYLIYREQYDDFLFDFNEKDGVTAFLWISSPGSAKRFSYCDACRLSVDLSAGIVCLYDCGKYWWVVPDRPPVLSRQDAGSWLRRRERQGHGWPPS